MSTESVLVTRPAPSIAVVKLNRPQRRNALTEEMFRGLGDALAELHRDTTARAVVLTGAGDAFCSGYDVDEVGRIASLAPMALLALLDRQSTVVVAMRELPQVVIAAVDGPAVGAGLSLALAADIRLLTTRARLAANFGTIGLSGGDLGASWLLPRIAGFGFATEMMLSGRFVSAEEARSHGLASRVTSPADLAGAALDTAERVAANSAVSIALTKRILQANMDAPGLEVVLRRENPVQVLAAGSPDVHEAVAAFRDRRAPRFADRPLSEEKDPT